MSRMYNVPQVEVTRQELTLYHKIQPYCCVGCLNKCRGCPATGSVKNFHWINTKNLCESHPCDAYLKTCLKHNSTTTKKISIQKSEFMSDKGKNWYMINDERGRYIVNTNSYTWKLSMIKSRLRPESTTSRFWKQAHTIEHYIEAPIPVIRNGRRRNEEHFDYIDVVDVQSHPRWRCEVTLEMYEKNFEKYFG